MIRQTHGFGPLVGEPDDNCREHVAEETAHLTEVKQERKGKRLGAHYPP